MPRRRLAVIPAITVLVILAGTVFQAQTTQRTLSFAQLTYGVGISALARTEAGDVWFGGATYSTTLPTTPDAIQGTASGSEYYGVIGRMTADGRVTYLSYFGRQSSVTAIALDAAGNVTVAGATRAADFPTTPGAYDRTCGADGTCVTTKWVPAYRQFMTVSNADGFVSTLSPGGDRIIYSTYLGGNDNDGIASVAVDSTGRLHVAGWTTSGDFPTTAGTLQPSFAHGTSHLDGSVLPDGFYARLSLDVSALQYGTYLGGSDSDEAASVAVDSAGDAFVTGSTNSVDFPTRNAVQPSHTSTTIYPNRSSDAWLARFSGSDAIFSTYVGGSEQDYANTVAVVGSDVYLGGKTCSPDFPGASPPSVDCNAFISVMRVASGGVSRTVVLPGGGWAGIEEMAVDANHLVYATGSTSGNAFAPTPDAAQRTSGGGIDAFLAVVDMRASGALVYATNFGGAGDEWGQAVTPDGRSGAYFGGSGFVAYVSVREGAPSTGGDIVLHARDASATGDRWQFVADSTAAGSTRIWNPDAGVPKIGTASPAPASFFELTFQAEAGVPYHLWLRMKADNDSWTNDSVFVQFSDTVDSSGNAIWRTGTSSATMVSLEDCSGCGERGWGWNDNGYDRAAPAVIFATTGTHTIRIQQREDGISIDQIVLSRSAYLSTPPGTPKDDTTILASSDNDPPADPREIVMHVAAERLAGGQNWVLTSDETAAGGARLLNADAGQAKSSSPSASGSDYFEVQFIAEAGVPYHLWIRSQATNDHWQNDSVFVQFSDSVDAGSNPIWRIGSDHATYVSLEDCSGCGEQGWGWNDNAYGAFAAPIYFAKSGPQTVRVLRREDGISIDQIVLSAGKYLNASPGLAKNDTTIVPK
jgi:hypothetical protein